MKFRILIQNLGRFPVEYGAITGIILGKVFLDYVVFQSFSLIFFVVGLFSVFFSLILLTSCDKIESPTCKDQQTIKS